MAGAGGSARRAYSVAGTQRYEPHNDEGKSSEELIVTFCSQRPTLAVFAAVAAPGDLPV